MKFTKELVALPFPEEREPMDLESFLRNDLIVVNRYAGEGGTKQISPDTYYVALGVDARKNPEEFKELLNRASFDESEYEGKNVSFATFFFNTEGLNDTAGIAVKVADKYDGSYIAGDARLTDEEKIAFFTHIVEEKPEAEPFVARSMNMVMERMEQERQMNKQSRQEDFMK